MTIDSRSGDDSSIFDPIEIMHEGMGRVPHVPPTTVAEWIAQTRETGILEFEQLLAIAEQDGDIMLDAVADNYARGRDDERAAIAAYYAELFQRAPFSIGDMLSDIRRNQHQKPAEHTANARKRARDFLEANK